MSCKASEFLYSSAFLGQFHCLTFDLHYLRNEFSIISDDSVI